mgnify:CR=1 FL=1
MKGLWRLPAIGLLLLAAGIVAQAQPEGWTVSLTGGISTPNNFNMPEQTTGFFGIDAGWRYRVGDEEWWMQRRNHPMFGAKASVIFVPDGIAGHRLGAAGYIWAPLKGRLGYHWGLGLSMYTRSACYTHDEANIYITTMLTCLIDLGLDYRLGDKTTLSLAFMHASNGKLNYPNKGLNYLQGAVEYGLSPASEQKRIATPQPKPEYSRNELGITLSGALAKEDKLDGSLYGCYDISLNYARYIDPVVDCGATLDLWFIGSQWEQIRTEECNWAVPVYCSALAFIEGFWGPISIKGGIGPVLLAPQRLVSIRFYERAGVYYNWSNNYVGVAINAHAGRAEFIEWSYGRRFRLGRGRR